MHFVLHDTIVTAGTTCSESALPDRGRDMGVGQSMGLDWVGFWSQSFQVLAQFVLQAKTKERKARAKMARISCHPLLMEREKVATRTARECALKGAA